MNLRKNSKDFSGQVWLLIICMIILFSCCKNIYAADKSLLTALKYQHNGDYPAAITEYYKIIENSPKNLDAYFSLAILLEIVLADYESAVHLYDKAISIAENKIAFFISDQGGRSKNQLNTLVNTIKSRKKILVDRLFSMIENEASPGYLVIESGGDIMSAPSRESKKIDISITGGDNEYQFRNIKNNWYHIVVQEVDDA